MLDSWETREEAADRQARTLAEESERTEARLRRELGAPAQTGGVRPIEDRQRQTMAILAQSRCSDLGLSYAVVRDLVLALYNRSVSELSLTEQQKLFAWLPGPKGTAKYQRAAETRELLLEVAGELTRNERKAAAEKAGTSTRPSELTAPELTALIGAYLDLYVLPAPGAARAA